MYSGIAALHVREEGSKKMKFNNIAYTVYDIRYNAYDVKYFGDNGLGVSDVYGTTQESQMRLRCILDDLKMLWNLFLKLFDREKMRFIKIVSL